MADDDADRGSDAENEAMSGNEGSSRADVLSRADAFYREFGGERYSDDQVDRWLRRWVLPFVTLKAGMRVLDLCCGDGCWSIGLKRVEPAFDVVGCDISEGGVEMARARADREGRSDTRFYVHDCATPLDEADASFDLIFARGIFLFNQHDFSRRAALSLLHDWHDLLKSGGRMLSMYGSKPELFGTYTPQVETVGYPINAQPERSPHRVFRGGKFNHAPSSFLRPFENLDNARIALYQFQSDRHTLISERVE